MVVPIRWPGGGPETCQLRPKVVVAQGVENSENTGANPKKIGWRLLGLAMHHLDLPHEEI